VPEPIHSRSVDGSTQEDGAVGTGSRGRVEFAPWPSYTEEEIDLVARVLRSGRVNYWTGDEGRAFEAEYASALGRRHAIAVANGTVALELALHAFGVGPGDEVITASRTFIASASAAVARGATPIIADVDRDSQNLTAATIEACITPRTRAVVVVHLAGWPCDMPAIMRLAEAHGLVVIEDCAQANGATIDGRPVGAYGHAGAFSFCQDKIITTGGEGGLLALDDDDAWNRAWSYKDHGKSFEAVFERTHASGFRWLHESFGTNWRMTELQAALGRLQLARLEESVAARNRHARTLIDGISTLPGIRVPVPPHRVRHAYYRLYAFVVPDALVPGWDRDRVMGAILEAGVPCFSGSCSEIYRELAFRRAGFGPSEPHPVAAELGDTSLAFLVHPTLSDDAVAFTIDVVRHVMRTATH
jgi:dTDP-4-amino-4,6-dideoxygalactose transaminase